jgi:hypothetical protein
VAFLDKKTREFRRPEDIARVFNRLARSNDAWKNAHPAERMAFLSMASPVFASYTREFLPLAGANALAFDFMGSPSHFNADPIGMGSTDEPKKRFWKSPVDAETTQDGTNYESDFMRGWYFLMDTLSIAYYDNAKNVSTGNYKSVRTRNIDMGPNVPFASPQQERWLIIGRTSRVLVREYQIFSHNPAVSGGAGVADLENGFLRQVPMFGNTRLVLDDPTGIAANDFANVVVTGWWHFSPYYMEPGPELDT